MPNETYTPDQMATAIAEIGVAVLQRKTGIQITQNGQFSFTPDTGYDGLASVSGTVAVSAGGAEAKDVNFYDYDGTILYSYSAQEFSSLEEMPENPVHEGLTAQSWNWTLIDAKTYVANYGKLDIGQTYIPTDGKTHVYFTLDSVHLTPYLGFGLNGTAVIDWGDGSVEETVTGNSVNVLIKTPHTYTDIGDHEITIDVTSGTLALKGNSTIAEGSYLLGSNDELSATANYYRNHITKVEIGSGITSIDQSAFHNCYTLQSIIIPESVMSIGSYAFQFCYALQSAIIPDGVTVINHNAFYGCYALQSITIPNAVTGIGTYAFSDCYALQNVVIPESVTIINNKVFQNCYTLQSITIPSGVTSIDTYAFASCYTLQSITIPSGVTSIDTYAFASCYTLQSITIPESVTIIGKYAFYNCCALQSIVIPESITSISDATFYACYALQSIVIPESVTRIGEYAFIKCYTMSSLTFTSTTPPTVAASNAFQDLPTDCVIRVPTGSLSAYTSATNYPSSSTYSYVEY